MLSSRRQVIRFSLEMDQGVEWFKATWLVHPDSPKQVEHHIARADRFREFVQRELQYPEHEADELIESLRAVERERAAHAGRRCAP